MTSKMRLAQKMCALFRALGVEMPCADAVVTISRIRPGHWQRSAGAWSWHLYAPIDRTVGVNSKLMHLGSQFSATDLAAARFVSLTHEGDALLVEPSRCFHMVDDPTLRFCKVHRIYDSKPEKKP